MENIYLAVTLRISFFCSDSSLQPVDMELEPGQADNAKESAPQQQDFEAAAARARCLYDYAWDYAMAAKGQPIAVR